MVKVVTEITLVLILALIPVPAAGYAMQVSIVQVGNNLSGPPSDAVAGASLSGGLKSHARILQQWLTGQKDSVLRSTWVAAPPVPSSASSWLELWGEAPGSVVVSLERGHGLLQPV